MMRSPRLCRTRLTQVLAFCAALLLVGTGCTNQQVQDFKDAAATAQEIADEFDPVIEDIQAQIDNAPEGTDVSSLQASLDVAVAEKNKYTKIADGYLDKIKDISDPGELLGEGLVSVAPAVPQPYGTWLGIAGVTIAGFFRARQRRAEKAAENVVISIEETKTPDGQIDFKLDADELRSRMSTEARELVEKARAKANRIDPRVSLLEAYVEDDVPTGEPAPA